MAGRRTCSKWWQRRRARPPKMWIYRNLTPWRIFACYDKGQLVVDEQAGQRDCEPCASKVLSIPALGELTVPHLDAMHVDTLGFRRRGQIKVRPAPSEFWSALPRAIVSFGWLAVGLVFGAWALFLGGGSAVPWTWFVAALVAVPVVALALATAREVLLYRRFRHYRARASASRSKGSSRGPGSATSSTTCPARRSRPPCSSAPS